MCMLFLKISIPPRRALLLCRPPTFAYHTLSPGISLIFQLGWVPSGNNICVKDVVALYYYAKDNFFLR